MIQITHYIYRQIGHSIHIGTEDNLVKFVAPWGESETFQKKIEEKLINMPVKKVNVFLKKTFHGFHHLNKFDTPLNNKIEDYK